MKTAAALAAVAGAAVLVLGLSYWLFFVRGVERAAAPPPPPPEVLLLEHAAGRVEVAGPDGVWHLAAPGSSVGPRESIRTDDAGAAELRASDGSTVRLLAGSQARVAELRRELQRLQLGAGQVEADVRDDPTRVFEVAVDGQDGVVRTRGAEFSAIANGQGTAAVASRRGEVILSARGKEVVIRTGQYARLRPGAPPDAPAPVPASLFLKVAWPAPASRERKLAVAGQTAPGARVQVDGRFVPVDADGRYRREVALPDGVHQLHVRATDVGGHVVDETSPRILVDTHTDFKVSPPNWSHPPSPNK